MVWKRNYSLLFTRLCVFATNVLADESGASDLAGISFQERVTRTWQRIVDLSRAAVQDDVGRGVLIIVGVISLLVLLIMFIMARSIRKQKKAIVKTKQEVDKEVAQLASDRQAAVKEINDAVEDVRKQCDQALADAAEEVDRLKDIHSDSVEQVSSAIKGVKLAWAKIKEWEKVSQQRFGQINDEVKKRIAQIEAASQSAANDSVKDITDKAEFERKLLKSWKYATEQTVKNGHQRASEVLTQAEELWKRINKEYPGTHEAFNNWGGVLLEQAKEYTGTERQKLIDDAIGKLMTSESVKRGAGAYNLACVYALMGNHAESRKWLEIGSETDMLEKRSHAMADEDLRAFWNEDWFRKLNWR